MGPSRECPPTGGCGRSLSVALDWVWTDHNQISIPDDAPKLYHFRCANVVWKTWATLKVKLFLWLAFKGRLWTVERRRCHGLVAATACHLCNQAHETVSHLFVSCPFTSQIWETILRRLDAMSTPSRNNSIQDHWRHARLQFPASVWKGADTLFALVTWQVWKERNARLFW